MGERAKAHVAVLKKGIDARVNKALAPYRRKAAAIKAAMVAKANKMRKDLADRKRRFDNKLKARFNAAKQRLDKKIRDARAHLEERVRRIAHAKHVVGAHIAVIRAQVMRTAKAHEARLRAKLNKARRDLQNKMNAEKRKVENAIKAKIAEANRRANAIKAKIARKANAIKRDLTNRANAEVAKQTNKLRAAWKAHNKAVDAHLAQQ